MLVWRIPLAIRVLAYHVTSKLFFSFFLFNSCLTSRMVMTDISTFFFLSIDARSTDLFSSPPSFYLTEAMTSQGASLTLTIIASLLQYPYIIMKGAYTRNNIYTKETYT